MGRGSKKAKKKKKIAEELKKKSLKRINKIGKPLSLID